MKKLTICAGVLIVSFFAFLGVRANQDFRTVNLPNSKHLSIPAPGFIAHTNSLPAALALSPDGHYAALLNQGYGTEQSGLRQSIAILDLANNQLRDFPDSRLPAEEPSTAQSYFVGLAFSSDGEHLYASMGANADSGIAVYKFSAGNVTPERFISIAPQKMVPGKNIIIDAGKNPPGTVPAYPAGIAVLKTKKGERLLVANNLSDNVVLVDSTSGQVLKSFDVSTSRYIPAAYPYTVITNKAGDKGWVSLWNESAIAELDLKEGGVKRRIELWPPTDPVAPGTHPTAMLLNKKEDTLYVAISNAGTAQTDCVAAVNLKWGVPTQCYRMTIDGSEPSAASLGIALSADERRLYAASGSLNAVAVFDTKSNDRSSGIDVELPLGFIPSEWYPSAVAISGDDLLIASAKGSSSGPNNMQAKMRTGLHPNDTHPYIAALLEGALQRLRVTEINENLASYTREVENNNLIHAVPEKIKFAAGRNPIRHVIYILKENRTYDQIFGDLGVGNGDRSLTMYGADITPNEHKLALQFGVIDNFYDSGDVSANGHLWSDASATSDYIEKTWPVIYRNSERPQPQGNPLDQDIAVPDDPGTGFIWDNLAKHNFSYRIYGEMLDATWCRDDKLTSPREGRSLATSSICPSTEIKPGEELPKSISYPTGGPSPWPWPIPRLKGVRATKRLQQDHIDPAYADFDIQYPDQLRADEFLREFDAFVMGRGGAKELPQFVLLWLPNDHTGGTRAGKPSPRASMADNDLAVGRVVDAVSHSPYWDDTAIFVVEDDAQDGPDHVDAHRSTALVISKYSPYGNPAYIDHHFYNTVNMVHTMEELLGLQAMNLFDSHAPLMAALFAGPGTQPAFQADYKNLRSGLLYEMNNKKAPGEKQSSKMDFSRPDEINAQQLNAILWEDARARRSVSETKHRSLSESR